MAQEVQQASSQRRSTDRMGTGNVLKLLLEFSIPGIVMMVMNALYNIIDSVFLGTAVGPDGIAVTTLAFPVMLLLMGLSALAGQGGNALTAILLGMGDHDKVERTLGNTVVLLITMAVIIFAFGIFALEPILAIVGTTAELHDMAQTFIRITLLLNAFQCLGMGLNNFLRTAGKPNLALITNVSGTVGCIVFNYLFVMVLGWGVAGSAYANAIGQAIGLVPTIYYFVFVKSAPFKLRISKMRPDFSLQGRILVLGIASFVTNFAGAVVNVILNQTLVKYGTLSVIGSAGALSAIGVAGKVNSFAIMPVIGVAMGAQSLVGFNYGAHLWARVKKILKYAVIFATCIMVLCFALIHLIPTPIVNLFGVTGDLETFTVYAMQTMTWVFPLVGYQIVGSNYFQASGQPLKAAILSLTRQVLFLIPLILLMPEVLPGIVGISSLEAICFAYPAADILAVLAVTLFIIPEMRRLTKRSLTDKGRSFATD